MKFVKKVNLLLKTTPLIINDLYVLLKILFKFQSKTETTKKNQKNERIAHLEKGSTFKNYVEFKLKLCHTLQEDFPKKITDAFKKPTTPSR